MFPTPFHFRIKSLIPRPIRLSMRRRLSAAKRQLVEDIWPIQPGSQTPPAGWPGWPEGKKFALVLTHDVESGKGRDRCRQLAEMETRLGFKSSFNFVPEKAYTTPKELRDHLKAAGFEIGVHDLRHDGRLYASRKHFSLQAKRINGYLKDWGASGFRSGYMLHNLDWLGELDAAYDASTFDIDPFEPQPDGVGTIFPFWVERADKSGGYIELPYTLPQDFTLFVLLQEKTIDIWKKKLEWIAAHGGMALVNVHPDYLSFNGRAANGEFPAALYEEFLTWVREKFAGQYYHALPKDVARFATEFKPAKAGRIHKRICMVTASIYESDNRVMRYAQTLAQRGDTVEILALARNEKSPRDEVINGVRVVRIQQKIRSNSKLFHLLSAMRFLVASSWLMAKKHLRVPYDLVHVHNMPDFLVFAAWLPKWRGAAVILDIHDIFPEFYASKFKSKGSHLLGAALRRCERSCAAFANHVILSNHVWYETFTRRSVSQDKCSVFINSVDPKLFGRRQRTRNDGKFVLIYPGSFNRHQGLDLAIRALAELKNTVPQAELHLYGDGPEKPSLIQLASDLALNGKVKFFEPRPLPQIPGVMAEADLGVVPKRASDFFGNEAFSTKIMEFMSQGLPVIVSRTRVDTYYYREEDVRFFESDSVGDLAKAIAELATEPRQRERLTHAGFAFVQRNSWDTRKQEYLDLVDSLSAPKFQGNQVAQVSKAATASHAE